MRPDAGGIGEGDHQRRGQGQVQQPAGDQGVDELVVPVEGHLPERVRELAVLGVPGGTVAQPGGLPPGDEPVFPDEAAVGERRVAGDQQGHQHQRGRQVDDQQPTDRALGHRVQASQHGGRQRAGGDGSERRSRRRPDQGSHRDQDDPHPRGPAPHECHRRQPEHEELPEVVRVGERADQDSPGQELLGRGDLLPCCPGEHAPVGCQRPEDEAQQGRPPDQHPEQPEPFDRWAQDPHRQGHEGEEDRRDLRLGAQGEVPQQHEEPGRDDDRQRGQAVEGQPAGPAQDDAQAQGEQRQLQQTRGLDRQGTLGDPCTDRGPVLGAGEGLDQAGDDDDRPGQRDEQPGRVPPLLLSHATLLLGGSV